MITDTETKIKGIKALVQSLGEVEAERFIALMQREPFNYTEWRQALEQDGTIEEISRRAMRARKNQGD